MRGSFRVIGLSIVFLAFWTHGCGDSSTESTSDDTASPTTSTTVAPTSTSAGPTTGSSGSTSTGEDTTGTTAGITTSGGDTDPVGSTTMTEPDPFCGDGTVDEGEECDEGDANDDNGTCTTLCTSAACGDGWTQPGEECDEGDANADDAACKSDCTLAACGDGIQQPGEACDDGNMVDDDACNNSCALTSCGDGVVQQGEECDDQNLDNFDDCNELCQFPSCEDGLWSGLETDLDCGGPDCGGCDIDLACNQPTDCGSGNCVDNVCAIANSCAQIKLGDPMAEDGIYQIDLDGPLELEPINAYCDMTTAGGGWTLVLNLDTSDGHVMWWANEKWTDAELLGTANKALIEDYKSEAWLSMQGAGEILLAVHEEGAYLGWKSFTKVDGATMYDHLQGGDNTLIGTGVVDSFFDDNLWPNEKMVRDSTQLYANHCIQNGGNCTTGSGGSPDGNRIGSNEAAPSNNVGGGLGNWSDMNYCCPNGFAGHGSGKICNNSAFRTVSEAQSGWAPCYNNGTGHFGTDTRGPSSNLCSNSGCSQANWSENNGFDYDYAIFLR